MQEGQRGELESPHAEVTSSVLTHAPQNKNYFFMGLRSELNSMHSREMLLTSENTVILMLRNTIGLCVL